MKRKKKKWTMTSSISIERYVKFMSIYYMFSSLSMANFNPGKMFDNL